jgi:signal transduction histidine kinase/ligand-binding sensor domain-containing protein
MLLVSVAPLRSQTLPLSLAQLDHASWNTRQGAPRGIKRIQQDPDGTLWLGTDAGLYNFDGIHFSLFQPAASDRPLPGTVIRCLYVSDSGTLWAGFGLGGIAEIRHHKVIRVYGESERLPRAEVSQVLESPDHTILAIVRQQLFRLRSGVWTQFENSAALNSEDVRQAFYDRSGVLWVATLQSVWCLPPNQDTFQKTREKGGFVAHFAQAPDGGIWMFTFHPSPEPASIRRLQVGRFAHSPVSSISGKFSDMLVDSQQFFWLATLNGVTRNRLYPLPDSASSTSSARTAGRDSFTHVDGLTSDATFSILSDRFGDIWVGTATGLDRFRKPILVPHPSKQISVEQHIALTICPSGQIWVASEESRLTEINDRGFSQTGPPLSPQFAYCDPHNVVWISDLSGLRRYGDGQDKLIGPPPRIPPFALRQVVGAEGHLFVSISRNGLWQYTGVWSRIEVHGFPDITPIVMFESARHQLWAGFVDGRVGVIESNSSGQTFSLADTGLSGEVTALAGTSFGMMAARTNGLAILQHGTFQKLLFDAPADAVGVSGILQDTHNDLWLNSVNGIIRVAGSEIEKALAEPAHRIEAVRFHDAGITGPAPTIFGIPTAARGADGRFWFVNSNTVVSVDPEASRNSEQLPILQSPALTVDGNPMAANHAIAHGGHTIRIGYLGVYLPAPDDVRYRARLEGLDSDWQDMASRPEAVFTNLRPGSYRFHVEASNDGQTWTPDDDSLAFELLPSFYQTREFLVLCIFVAAGIVWFGLQFRVRQITRAIRARAEERADERVRIARDLHDTLLQGVQGLMLRFNVVAESLPRESKTRAMLDGALDSADQIIVEGRDRVAQLRADGGGIDSSRTVSEDLLALGLSLNPHHAVAFSVKTLGNVTAFHPNAFADIYDIAREALINAFRHSQATVIEIELSFDPKVFSLICRDNGRGIESRILAEGRKDNHWGLVGMRERAHKLGANLEIRSQQGSGTEVILTLAARYAYQLRPGPLSKAMRALFGRR